MKHSQARKQLRFMADEHLEAALLVHAAAHGVTISALCTAILSAEMRRGVHQQMVLELTPSIKAEFRKMQRSLIKEFRPWLVRATFEAVLTRLLLLELHGHPQDGSKQGPHVKETLRRLVPEAKERLRNPYFGLEEFAGRDEEPSEIMAKGQG